MGELGDLLPSPQKLAQKRKNGKNHTKIEKFMTRISKAGICPEFFQRELAAAKPMACQQISIPASQSQPFRLRSSVRTSLRKFQVLTLYCLLYFAILAGYSMLLVGKTLSRRGLCLIISLALLKMSQSTYSSCLSEVRSGMGANNWGHVRSN